MVEKIGSPKTKLDKKLNTDTNLKDCDKNKKQDKKDKYLNLISQVDPKILDDWKNEQNKLKDKLIETDYIDFTDKSNSLPTKICGVDISASKIDSNKAIVGIVVVNTKDFSILYENYNIITMTEPYIPGFLAFREVNHIIGLLNKIKNTDNYPDVILVDGNGILHCNRFGLACHLGVLLDTPTIGCGKSVFAVDGITSKQVQYLSKENLHKKGDYIELKGFSGSIWGVALRSTDLAYIPIIVSVGHKISLETSIKIIQSSTNYRVPEPIRIADLTTRFLLRYYEKINFKDFDISDYLSKNKRDFLVKDIDC